MSNSLLPKVYLGIASIELLTHLFPMLHDFHYVTKPLLMPILIVWLYMARKNAWDLQDKLIAISLIFSWLGDIALMFTDPFHFMLGLGSFLIAHILYIVVFSRFRGENYLVQAPYWLILIGLAGASILYIIYPNLKEMLLPVVVYMLTILTMIAFALNLKHKISSQAFFYLMAGAVSFMVSDSLIAINKFAIPFLFAPFFIMFLYILGQMGIVYGYLQAKN